MNLKLTCAAIMLSFALVAPVSAYRYYPGYTYTTYPAYYQPVVYQQVPVRYERVVRQVPVVRPVVEYVRPAYVHRPYRAYHRPYYRPYSRGGISFSFGF